MKGSNLGEFEEVVLLTIASLDNRTYSVAVVDHLSDQINRKVKLGVVHAILARLEKKGHLRSEMGEPTMERGGKRKRYYSLTSSGFAAINRSREIRERLWGAIPKLVIEHFK